jgi:hypothetical protein
MFSAWKLDCRSWLWWLCPPLFLVAAAVGIRLEPSTDVLVVSAWLAAGWLGSWLVWRDWARLLRVATCPSPRQILAYAVFGGLLGAVTLVAGLMLEELHRRKVRPARDSWWTRPLCGPREEP